MRSAAPKKSSSNASASAAASRDVPVGRDIVGVGSGSAVVVDAREREEEVVLAGVELAGLAEARQSRGHALALESSDREVVHRARLGRIEFERGAPRLDGLLGEGRGRERLAELHVRGHEVGNDLGELVPDEDRLVPHAAAAVVGKPEREVRRRAVGIELDSAARRADRLVVEVAVEEQVGEQRVHERVGVVDAKRLVARVDRGSDVPLAREPLGEERLLAAAAHDAASGLRRRPSRRA